VRASAVGNPLQLGVRPAGATPWSPPLCVRPRHLYLVPKCKTFPGRYWAAGCLSQGATTGWRCTAVAVGAAVHPHHDHTAPLTGGQNYTPLRVSGVCLTR
jgi:hypothetical protein